jgi:hypothetical protein
MALDSAYQRDDGSRNMPGEDSSWSDWVAASKTYNYCVGDPLIDWLEAFGREKGFESDEDQDEHDERTDFRKFIFSQGRKFEAAVFHYLSKRHGLVVVGEGSASTRTRAAVDATWVAMNDGVEIIGQGVLWNAQTQTFGAPDLLVRSDVLQGMFPEDLDAADVAAPARDLALERNHYCVVDVKFTTLHLLKNGHAASNHLKYMAQVWLYNEALGRIQGYTPQCAYLLGRRWQTSKERGESAVERLARVDSDLFVKSANMDLGSYSIQACDWVRRVRREGSNWEVLPEPTIPELRPNRRTDDQPWHSSKMKIARELEDLTLLPRVNPAKRELAIQGGLFRWTDPACTAERLGITGEKLPRIVDGVIGANQSDPGGPIVFPSRIVANEEIWRDPVAAEFFVDFETVSDLDDDFSSFPIVGGQPLIFMIGCGQFVPTANGFQWVFRSFTANVLNEPGEKRIIDDWIAYLLQTCEELGVTLDDARIFHWSPAELTTLTNAYNSAQERQEDSDWPILPWVDLLGKVVREEPVTVRGAFGFGLKAIAQSLQKSGLIETSWSDGPSDGLGAMVGAWRANQEALLKTMPMTETKLMQEIGAYNEVDCKVMAEALGYFRQHH